MVLWLKAWHLIAVIAWMAGLFYLPRLYVYHVQTAGYQRGCDRFVVMERKLYYYITWPAGVLATMLGVQLATDLHLWHSGCDWFYAKLFLASLLWVFHLACGHYRRCLQRGAPSPSERFFRVFNEVPTLIMIAIVILAEVKPF